jgi:hypothetical protein
VRSLTARRKYTQNTVKTYAANSLPRLLNLQSSTH